MSVTAPEPSQQTPMILLSLTLHSWCGHVQLFAQVLEIWTHTLMPVQKCTYHCTILPVPTHFIYWLMETRPFIHLEWLVTKPILLRWSYRHTALPPTGLQRNRIWFLSLHSRPLTKGVLRYDSSVFCVRRSVLPEFCFLLIYIFILHISKCVTHIWKWNEIT